MCICVCEIIFLSTPLSICFYCSCFAASSAGLKDNYAPRNDCGKSSCYTHASQRIFAVTKHTPSKIHTGNNIPMCTLPKTELHSILFPHLKVVNMKSTVLLKPRCPNQDWPMIKTLMDAIHW